MPAGVDPAHAISGARDEVRTQHEQHGLPKFDVQVRVKMNRMRTRIATRLKDAQNTYAMLTTFNEIDMR